jgi:hypothetical protein
VSGDDIGSNEVRALPSGLETANQVVSEYAEGYSDRTTGLSEDGR